MKKIMIVDDEPDQIFAAKIFLEKHGEYEVIGANNGPHCFELLGQGQIPDLILLDIMMPEMSGWTVHDRLKKKSSEFKKIPIIFLTGDLDPDSIEIGGWFGEDFIEKPYDREDLKKRIDAVLKNKDKVK